MKCTPIKDYEGLYSIYEDGRVYSHQQYAQHKPKFIKIHTDRNGYAFVVLSRRQTRKFSLLHRLVANAFIPNPENKKEVNHKDGNKLNNHVDNLEWVTAEENMQHSFRELNRKPANRGKFGYDHNRSKEVFQYSLDNTFISSYGSMSEASRATGASVQNISRVCMHKGLTAGNYKWRYGNETERNLYSSEL